MLFGPVYFIQVIAKFKGQPSVLYDMDVFQSEQLLMACGRDKLVKVFDTRTMKLVRSMRGHQNTVSCIVANEHHKQVRIGFLFSSLYCVTTSKRSSAGNKWIRGTASWLVL